MKRIALALILFLPFGAQASDMWLSYHDGSVKQCDRGSGEFPAVMISKSGEQFVIEGEYGCSVSGGNLIKGPRNVTAACGWGDDQSDARRFTFSDPLSGDTLTITENGATTTYTRCPAQ